MTDRRRLARLFAFLVFPARLAAQHHAHDAPSRPVSGALGAQAVASVTRLTNALDGRTRTEAYLSQPTVMGHAALAGGALQFTGTLNLEGLTLRRGELLGGVYGEGYVDRRHPHTMLHEAMVAARATLVPRWLDASIAVGKGFAPFGSDDPMTRPFERYPINHHLAQILERAVIVAALRMPRALLELSTFDGDEPLGAYAWPRMRRFGDSRSLRLTVLPLAPAPMHAWTATGLELSASAASVASPEAPHGGGLDQQKYSVAARWSDGAPLGAASTGNGRYALVEWAQTDWLSAGERIRVPGYRNVSLLAEGGARRRGVEIVARAERTDRLEEERDVDAFRTVRPATDVSTLGLTRWTTFTLGIARPMAIGASRVGGRVAPFLETSLLVPRAAVRGAVFDPRAFYGGEHLWALTAGVRLGAGMSHARMGRYGVASAEH